jgi:hypothetical protein
MEAQQKCHIHHMPKIKPRIQPFSNDYKLPKIKGSAAFTDAV